MLINSWMSLYPLGDVKAKGDDKTNVVVFLKADVHHHGFGCVGSDVIEWYPLLELVDILELSEVRVGSGNVNSNGGL